MKINGELTYHEGVGKESGTRYSYIKFVWTDEQGKQHTTTSFSNKNIFYLTKQNFADLKAEAKNSK